MNEKDTRGNNETHTISKRERVITNDFSKSQRAGWQKAGRRYLDPDWARIGYVIQWPVGKIGQAKCTLAVVRCRFLMLARARHHPQTGRAVGHVMWARFDMQDALWQLCGAHFPSELILRKRLSCGVF